MGYIGSTVPFIVCIALIFGGPALFGWSTTACTRASFVITALWWVAFTIPLLTSYKQVHYRATAGQAGEAIRARSPSSAPRSAPSARTSRCGCS